MEKQIDDAFIKWKHMTNITEFEEWKRYYEDEIRAEAIELKDFFMKEPPDQKKTIIEKYKKLIEESFPFVSKTKPGAVLNENNKLYDTYHLADTLYKVYQRAIPNAVRREINEIELGEIRQASLDTGLVIKNGPNENTYDLDKEVIKIHRDNVMKASIFILIFVGNVQKTGIKKDSVYEPTEENMSFVQTNTIYAQDAIKNVVVMDPNRIPVDANDFPENIYKYITSNEPAKPQPLLDLDMSNFDTFEKTQFTGTPIDFSTLANLDNTGTLDEQSVQNSDESEDDELEKSNELDKDTFTAPLGEAAGTPNRQSAQNSNELGGDELDALLNATAGISTPTTPISPYDWNSDNEMESSTQNVPNDFRTAESVDEDAFGLSSIPHTSGIQINPNNENNRNRLEEFKEIERDFDPLMKNCFMLVSSHMALGAKTCVYQFLYYMANVTEKTKKMRTLQSESQEVKNYIDAIAVKLKNDILLFKDIDDKGKQSKKRKNQAEVIFSSLAILAQTTFYKELLIQPDKEDMDIPIIEFINCKLVLNGENSKLISKYTDSLDTIQAYSKEITNMIDGKNYTKFSFGGEIEETPDTNKRIQTLNALGKRNLVPLFTPGVFIGNTYEAMYKILTSETQVSENLTDILNGIILPLIKLISTNPGGSIYIHKVYASICATLSAKLCNLLGLTNIKNSKSLHSNIQTVVEKDFNVPQIETVGTIEQIMTNCLLNMTQFENQPLLESIISIFGCIITMTKKGNIKKTDVNTYIALVKQYVEIIKG